MEDNPSRKAFQTIFWIITPLLLSLIFALFMKEAWAVSIKGLIGFILFWVPIAVTMIASFNRMKAILSPNVPQKSSVYLILWASGSYFVSFMMVEMMIFLLFGVGSELFNYLMLNLLFIPLYCVFGFILSVITWFYKRRQESHISTITTADSPIISALRAGGIPFFIFITFGLLIIFILGGRSDGLGAAIYISLFLLGGIIVAAASIILGIIVFFMKRKKT